METTKDDSATTTADPSTSSTRPNNAQQASTASSTESLTLSKLEQLLSGISQNNNNNNNVRSVIQSSSSTSTLLNSKTSSTVETTNTTQNHKNTGNDDDDDTDDQNSVDELYQLSHFLSFKDDNNNNNNNNLNHHHHHNSNRDILLLQQALGSQYNNITLQSSSSASSKLLLQRIGKIKCMCVDDSSSEMIAFGTSKGYILLYHASTRKRLAILGSSTSIVGHPASHASNSTAGSTTTTRTSNKEDAEEEAEENHHCVTSLAFGAHSLTDTTQSNSTVQRRVLIAGYHSGMIALWSTETFLPLKLLDSQATTLSQPIVKLIALQQQQKDIESSGIVQACVALDQSGQVRLICLHSNTFSYSTSVESIRVYEPVAMSGEQSKSAASDFNDNRLYGEKVDDDDVDDNNGDFIKKESFVCDISVLPKGEAFIALNRVVLLALTTKQNVVIKCIRPEQRTVAILSLESSPAESSPVVAWLKNQLPDGQYEIDEVIPFGVSPKIAVCWGKELKVYQLLSDVHMNVKFSLMPNYEMTLPVTPIQLTWLSKDVVGVVSSDLSTFTIVIPTKKLVVKEIDIRSIDVLYTSDIMALGRLQCYDKNNNVVVERLMETGNNDSNSIQFRFQYRSGVIHGSSSVCLFGRGGLISIRCVSWDEKIKKLCARGRYQEAFDFVSSILAEKSQDIPLIGIPYTLEKVKLSISQMMPIFISKYAQDACATRLDERRAVDLAKTCLRYCVEFGSQKAIITLLKLFNDQGRKLIFIETLIRECLVTGRLTNFKFCDKEQQNELLGDIVRQFSVSTELISTLEAAVLNLELDKSIFDIELLRSVYNISKPSVFLRANIYAQNALQNQYIAPLKDVITFIEDKSVGATVIDYLRACASGRSISSVFMIERAMVPSIKQNTLEFVFGKSAEAGVLLQLMEMYPKQLFDILEIYFFDSSSSSPFTNDDVDNNNIALTSFEDFIALEQNSIPSQKYDRQEIFNHISSIIYRADKKWTDEQLSQAYLFEAKLLHAGYIHQNFKRIESVTRFIMTHLAHISNGDNLIEIQNIVQTLIGLLGGFELDFDYYIDLSEKCKCFHLAAFLYNKKHNFLKAIQSYLLASGSDDVFNYLVSLTSIDMKTNYFNQINRGILANIVDLLRVNAHSSVNIVLEHFHHLHQDIVDVLMSVEYERELYLYLDLLLSNYNNSDDVAQRNIELNDDLLFDYVRLMCKFESEKVKDYLSRHQVNRVDDILQICGHIPGAKYLLLEKKGEIFVALGFRLTDMQNLIDEIMKTFEQKAQEQDPKDDVFKNFMRPENLILTDEHVRTDPVRSTLDKLPKFNGQSIDHLAEVNSLMNMLSEVIDMCARNTQRKTIDDKLAHKLWFTLFKKFCDPLRRYQQLYWDRLPSHQQLSDDTTEGEEKLRGDYQNDERRVKLFLEQLSSMKQEMEEETDEEKKQELKEDILKKAKLAKMTQQKMQRTIAKLKELEHAKRATSSSSSSSANPHKLANLWMQKILYNIVALIIRRMVQYIPVSDVTQHLIADQKNGEFYHIRYIILRLLDKQSDQLEVLETMNNLLEADHFVLSSEYQAKLTRAIYPSTNECIICRRPLYGRSTPDRTVRVKSNGDAFHMSCHKSLKQKKPTSDINDIQKTQSSQVNYDAYRESLKQVNEVLDSHTRGGKMHLYHNLQIESGLVSVKKKKTGMDSKRQPYCLDLALMDATTKLNMERVQREHRATNFGATSKFDRSTNFDCLVNTSITAMDGVDSLQDLLLFSLHS